MSVAAAQYSKFREQIVKEDKVFTFVEQGELLVFQVDGNEVVPFWSSRSRLEKIQQMHPKYQKYEIVEWKFEKFWQLLPRFAQDNIHVGANWSGKRLVGYDVSVQDLIACLEYHMNGTAKE